MGAWAESEEEGEGEILQPTPEEFFFFFPTPTISKIQRLGDYRTSSGRDGGRVWGGRRGLARGGTRVWPVRYPHPEQNLRGHQKKQ